MTDEHPGTEELALRLRAYASARLEPRHGAAARMREALVEEARMRSLEASIARSRGRGHPARRRFAALLLAAGLTIAAAAGAAAASTAGGPIYGARVWIEAAMLPADGNARALERIHQIDERVLEVERAAQSGDQNAVAAAIVAYREAVQAAMNEVGSDDARLAHLKAALGLHVTVLQTLATEVPAQAVVGIDRAIDSSQKAVDKIDHTTPDNGKTNNGQPGSTDTPAATDTPTPTDKPGHTPAPHATPDHTPGH